MDNARKYKIKYILLFSKRFELSLANRKSLTGAIKNNFCVTCSNSIQITQAQPPPKEHISFN